MPLTRVWVTPASRSTLKWCDSVDFDTDASTELHDISSRSARVRTIWKSDRIAQRVQNVRKRQLIYARMVKVAHSISERFDGCRSFEVQG